MNDNCGLVVIAGPTAVGKSKLSVELAIAFDGEIVSADSMQIYRGMDIGTAKITPEEKKGIPHWGIDIIDPDTPFSVSDYRDLADGWLRGIWQRGRLPFLVGGTGLYIRAVTEEYDFSTFSGDAAFREKMEQMARREGPEALHRQLAFVDPATASRLHPNDIRRVIRALEIYEFTGKRLSESKQSHGDTRFPVLKIGLTSENRELLYDRINRRVDLMIEQGLLEEVSGLLRRGAHKDLISMQGIGYKEIIEYLEQRLTLQEAVERIKQGSRRYAKRQLSWFRRDPEIHWFAIDTIPWDQLYNACFKLVKEFRQQVSNTVVIKEDGGTAK
ncbi:tRNA (adenosine(37)-N6)-dimethylallyltransferase MiaA [Effusibacillus dendaii]|uniref:tRNA dimethylallyltransferase n=1 Tax=Effusibacillus dendaii TaxID=2743772 RepID=A0A7I8DA76_9BACL|nr:tRNA (adenosine(37)-N6)-dimethylallyltransferase MiaA [Effusibacillus dendaii]BCJ85726.1 tRNA dimethylallyltransferase [Effusibacillus dendaii]